MSKVRRYETTVIVNPALSQEERQSVLDKLTNLISDAQGLLVKFDEWGEKRLAYEIKKETRGYYVLTEFCGGGSLVKELERNLRLDDRALKYMTVCIDKEVDPERVKAEIEAAAKEEEESKPEPVQEVAAGEAQEEAPAEETQPGETPPEETSEPTTGETEGQENQEQANEEEEPANGSV
ncbi:MAG: 30S ribosomal protein S6 [Deltaproteobacteria bacterium]|nr:30S ribosomal protein S6 [Deltaproteobacteria bacterium]